MKKKESRKTVLFIIGDVRSGTTLLENLLSKSPDIISVGELRNFSDHYNKIGRGKTWDWKCSCGEMIDKCEYWQSILKFLEKKGIDRIENTKIHNTSNNKDNKKASNIIFNIYDAIFSNHRVQFIVDSSKVPEHGGYLYNHLKDDIWFKFIFIKRDLRAVSLSKQKWNQKFKIKKRSLFRMLLGSKHVELDCKKYLRSVSEDDKIFISYEDLSKKPDDTIHKICDKFGINKFKVPEYMYLENDHTIGGTPNRFKKRKIVYDDSWKEQMAGKPLFRYIGKLLNSI